MVKISPKDPPADDRSFGEILSVILQDSNPESVFPQHTVFTVIV
jgi:hypothetical protein